MLILCLFSLHLTIQKDKENITLHHTGKVLNFKAGGLHLKKNTT